MSITPKDQAIALIRRADKILCLSQEESRADGIAAVMAFRAFGEKLGKEIVAVLPQGVSDNLKFLPGAEHIEEDLGEPGDFVISLSTLKSQVERVKYTLEDDSVDIIITPKNGSFKTEDVSFRHNSAHFDLVVVFDSPSLEALGSVFSDHTELFASAPILNISANPGTADFGKVNLIDAAKSSSCEILFDCVQSDKDFSSLLDAPIASSLLTGMVASTGSFLRPNTTASSLEAAAILQNLGAEQSDIIEHLFKQKSFNTLKLWGRVFSSLEVDPFHRLGWAYLTKNDFSQLETSPREISDIADEILRYTEDIDIATLVLEQDNTVLIQLRTKSQNLAWPDFILSQPHKATEHGLDLTLTDTNAVNATDNLVKALVQWQKERLNLEADKDISLLRAAADKTPAPTLPIETVKPSSSVKATPPAEVPFSAPLKNPAPTKMIPEEHTVPPGTQAAEVVVDIKEKGIPEWLKKSFPKN